MLCYLHVICVFCLLVVLVRSSVPVQVNRLERLVSEMTYNVLMGTLNPTHSLTLSASPLLCVYQCVSDCDADLAMMKVHCHLHVHVENVAMQTLACFLHLIPHRVLNQFHQVRVNHRTGIPAGCCIPTVTVSRRLRWYPTARQHAVDLGSTAVYCSRYSTSVQYSGELLSTAWLCIDWSHS